MTFQIWSGMLVFNVVVIAVNIRIYILSSQVSIILVLVSIFSVLSYYLIFFIVEVILYSDVKNVLNHQLASPLFWLTMLVLVFVIEGSEYAYLKLSQSMPSPDDEKKGDRQELAEEKI